MDKEQWRTFINLWESGDYDNAVKLPLENQELGSSAVIDKLFRKDSSTSTLIIGISLIDIFYDYLMVNPDVIDAINFARAEDLANFFSFQQFAEGFDFENVGELSRLKGYTAENLVALELQGKGHDISFPETSNQEGFDLIVDGQPFQVKCLSEPSGVYEHFQKYPDIPVIANKELMETLDDHPLVYGTEVSNQLVIETTNNSLKHAAELGKLDIPIITMAVSSLSNGYKIIADGLEVRLASLNIVNETVSRSVAAFAGKGIGVVIGPAFGPAGLVVMPMFLGLAGAFNGGKITSQVKKLYTRKERELVLNNLYDLVNKVLEALPKKEKQREDTFTKVKQRITNHQVLKHISHLLDNKHEERQKYSSNKRKELEKWLDKISKKFDIETDTYHILDTVIRSQVHPHIYQDELKTLGHSYRKLLSI
ncbi:hypothetical protein [Salirhabdus salicampi]|uniref:hypothetical protein n=1 Tax=Salirhabdus salicampi TaxID=476102 RepID=UPI0020C1F084|nr:hypothetical protein [Salirhabdus salicampi]MCP8616377.1 hypothetical protein [Salirhabdus salicampi]